MLQLSQKAYDNGQWFVRIFIPAFIAFYVGVDQFVNLPHEAEVAGVSGAFAVFLGGLLQTSSTQFKKNNELDGGTLYPKGTDPDTGIADLGLLVNKLPNELLANKTVTFKVGELPPEIARRYYGVDSPDSSTNGELEPPG